MAGAGSATVTFSFTTGIAGLHKVNIGSLLAPFEVKPSPPAVVTEAPAPEITSFSSSPGYREGTNTLVNARIVYQVSQSWDSLSNVRLILTVLFNGQLLEQIPLLAAEQLQADGMTGEMNYLPALGWEAGEYAFQVELFEGENLSQVLPLQRINVTPEMLSRVVSWKTLGIIIGSALALGLMIIGLVLYFRRDTLRDYWK